MLQKYFLRLQKRKISAQTELMTVNISSSESEQNKQEISKKLSSLKRHFTDVYDSQLCPIYLYSHYMQVLLSNNIKFMTNSTKLSAYFVLHALPNPLQLI